MNETTTAPPVVDGDGTFIGETWHVYYSKLDAWVSSRDGTIVRPETPPELPRPQESETTFRPPIQPNAVRIRKADGTSETVPLTKWGGYEVVVRPFGDDGYGAVVALPAHEIAELKFVFTKENKP
jgi:hypothetical protein